MPTITIPILPLLLALPGVAVAFGASVALMIYVVTDKPFNPNGLRKVALMVMGGSVLTISALAAIVITYLPWDAP